MHIRPHPNRMRPDAHGFSHGLKKCPPDTFLPSLRSGRPFKSTPPIRNKKEPSFRMTLFVSGGAGGIWYIFAYGENYGVNAVKPALSNAPPERCIEMFKSLFITTYKNNTHPDGWVLFFWRSRRDLNPRYPFGVHTISSRARYDHFDTAPCGCLSDSFHMIAPFDRFVKGEFGKSEVIFRLRRSDIFSWRK